jgi:hypothetical protein
MLKTSFGLTKSAALVLAQFAERAADDIMEGLLAGGIIYYHGAALAAECLAPDPAPENMTDPYELSPYDCVMDGKDRAAEIIKDALTKQKNQLRGKFKLNQRNDRN